MENSPLPPELQQKIKNARSLPGRPLEDRFVQPATVAQTLHERVMSHPGAPYLTYLAEDGAVRAYTFAEFYTQVRRVAAMLYVFAGVRRGDRVATAMHNHDQTIIVNFAVWHLGASVVPLNMGEEDKRLAYVLEHSGVKAVFVLNDYVARMRPLLKDAAKIEFAFIVGGNGDAGADKREVLLRDVTPPVDVPQFSAPEGIDPDDEALIVYTSGTTGVPKGVVLSQYNLVADAYAITRWHNFGPSTRMMCVLPVHHVNGLVVTHLTPMFCGGQVVLTRKFSAKDFFTTVAKYDIQIVSVVPTLLQFLLEATPLPDHKPPVSEGKSRAPALQYVICGAGPLTVDLAARFEDRFGIPICHGYGLSESTCYSCYLPVATDTAQAEHRKWMRDFGYPSIGVAIETNLISIHDDNGREVPEGQKGEIVIRGHNIMPGYHDNLKANENAFTFGWFRSGDEGFYKRGSDGEKYIFISGRFKELIIRGGVKISPLEVDEVLNRVPGVKAAMAVGFENTCYGEEVGAYVVKLPGVALSADDVLKACREKMPAWMSPKVVVFGETFPVTSTGKYQRNQLKPLFAAHKDTQFRDK